jgi:hypothetical protein
MGSMSMWHWPIVPEPVYSATARGVPAQQISFAKPVLARRRLQIYRCTPRKIIASSAAAAKMPPAMKVNSAPN